MKIRAWIDENQENTDTEDFAFCPICGRKLIKVYSVFHPTVFRLKCPRCKRYIKIRCSIR